MPSSFHGITVASNALRAYQLAMDVTGHNVANVETPGYSRQVVDLASLDPIAFWFGSRHLLGQGVTISSVSRARDIFLQARQLRAEAELGRIETLSSALGEVESLLAEGGSPAISDALSAFFNSWSALGSSPTEAAMRMQVRAAGQALAGTIRNAYQSLRSLSDSYTERVSMGLATANDLAERIAALNARVIEAGAEGTPPNDLLDQRDAAVKDLARLLDVTTTSNADGSVIVCARGFTLVDRAGALPLPTTFDAASMTLGAAGLASPVPEGEIAGLMQAMNAIADLQSRLDTLASTLAAEVNAIHRTGTNALGATGLDFFAGTGAGDISLNIPIQASADAIAAGTNGLNDGSLALRLSALKETSLATLGGKPMPAYFIETVGGLGFESAAAKAELLTQEHLLRQLEAQLMSVSGVSLEEEVANMMRYQRAFQANARLLSVLDQVTEDLIGIIDR